MSNPNPAEAWAWLQTNSTLLATIAAAVTVLILCALIVRAYRRGGVDGAAMAIAAPLVIGWEAEGVYEVLRRSDAPISFAIIGCFMTSMVMINLGAKGHKHFTKYGNIGPNGRAVWYIAIPVGIIVAASADTASMQGLRILIPVLGATLWWSEYRPDEPNGRRKQRGSWRWTPRNFGIWIGAITPGDDDIETLHHARGVRQLVNAQYALKYGRLAPRWWRERRVRRIARNVSPAIVNEAYEQMQRIELVVAMTAPDYRPPQPEDARKSSPDAAETPQADKPAPKGGPARTKTTPAPPKKWVPAPVLVEQVRAYQHRNPGASVAQAARALGYDTRHVQKTMKAAESDTDNTAPETPSPALAAARS